MYQRKPGSPSAAAVLARALKSPESEHKLLAVLVLMHCSRQVLVQVTSQGRLLTSGQLLAELRRCLAPAPTVSIRPAFTSPSEPPYRYGLIRTSRMLRKVNIGEPFQLIFQVIDRQGAICTEARELVCRIVAIETHSEEVENTPQKRERILSGVLQGNSEIHALATDRLVFSSLWLESIPPNSRLQLRAECDLTDIKALDLPEIQVTATGRKRPRTET